MLFTGWEVRTGKIFCRGLKNGPRPNSSVAILNLRSVALTLLEAWRAADTLLKRESKSRLVATEFRCLQLVEGQER